jgi:hypothetical protein
MGAGGNRTDLPHPRDFEVSYPAITRWVKDLGNVEFGYDRDTGTFDRATDESGVWFAAVTGSGPSTTPCEPWNKGSRGAWRVWAGTDPPGRPTTPGTVTLGTARRRLARLPDDGHGRRNPHRPGRSSHLRRWPSSFAGAKTSR